MKKFYVLLILVTVAFAVNTRVQTVLTQDNDNHTNIGTTLNDQPSIVNTSPIDFMPLIGRTEIIGHTSFDIWYNGPTYTDCRVDPVANGIHCHWMYSMFAPGTDRNERYNFYDFATRTWLDAEGFNAFASRSGFGGMDFDPITGCAVVSTHQTISSVITPVAARDQAPGAGLFEYSISPAGWQWPAVAVTNNQAIHFAEMLAGTYDLLYTRCQPWGTWTTPLVMQTTPATFPDHNIAASKTSNKVIIMWVNSNDTISVRGFYKLSTDGGNTWGAETQIPFPPSTIAGAGFYITSLFAMFDNSDNLHIVADISNGSLIFPAEIWHYCPTNPQPWTLIHHCEPDSIAAGIGSNALMACRPTIVQASGTNGNFYVAWEEFDPLNTEPTTSQLRAEVWVAELTNNGQTVTRKGRITDLNTTSKRYPCLGGVMNDTVFVRYLMDSIAGFYSAATPVGAGTWNPVILHRFHKNSLPQAIEEENPGSHYLFSLSTATPNPFNFNTRISYSLPTASNVDLTIYDILGRPVKTLASGTKTVGTYTATWDGRTNSGEKAQAGIYFYTLTTPDRSISRKLIRTY